MSALAGLWNFDGRVDAAQNCSRMLAAQRIYGPHGVAHWDGGFVALGRTLFRLLPEDVHDRQPFAAANGRMVLVADIRLDNREELCTELGIQIGSQSTHSDAAVLLSALERWGEDCLHRIVGDFAFALWNSGDRKLLLVRDPLGQRPLHFHRNPGGFAFASMPKGLHSLPHIERAPNEERVAEFVALLPEAGSQTFFKGIERVEAGHVVTVTAKGISARRYWQPERQPIRYKNPHDYAEAVRSHMDTAIRARLRGMGMDIGTHLSAGLDSSVVTGSAARALLPLGGRVFAFTSVPREGYPNRSGAKRIADEGAHAALTASMHPNVEHVLVRGAQSPLDDLDRYFFLFERPVTNLCNGVWFNAINDAARARGLGVMLTGFMGNMTISYNGVELLPQYWGRGQWLKWGREIAALVRNRRMSWLGALAHSFGPYLSRDVWNGLNRMFRKEASDVTVYSAINPHRLKELGLPALAFERDLDLSYRPRKDDFETRLWALRRVDMGNFQKGTLAGWGIDQRDPTIDRRLVEFCLNIPADQFLSKGVTRALARRSFVDRVPKAVLDERRRGLQGADWHERLTAAHGQVLEEIDRLNSFAPAARMLNLGRLNTLVHNWPKGGWERESVTVPYRLALLRAISTGHFLRKASGSNQ